MAIRGWRPGAVAAVAVLAAICVSGSEDPGTVLTAASFGPLPADRYGFTPQDYQLSEQAQGLLVRTCMAGKGHPDFPVDPQFLSSSGSSTTTAIIEVGTTYGVLDPGTAGRWGYGWDPARHTSSTPKGRPMTGAEFADWPGCSTAAARRLLRGVDVGRDWLYASKRALEVDRAVKADPRLRAAWATWSGCMANQGFTRYPDPTAAYQDPAWHRDATGNTAHTRRERATAVADAACKARHRTAEIWHAVQVRQQNADIARHRAGYAAGLRAMRTYRANTAQVLGELG